MAESTTPKTYAGMTELELGFLIGGVGLAVLLLIIIITCVVVRKSRSKKSKLRGKGDDGEKLVSMQTARTVDGQHMTQVIMKSQPNGNMDRQNEQNMPYQTMDPETNTVRYVTASQPARAEVQNEEEVIDLSKDTQHEVAENDSGHGESPSRAPVDVHSTHDNEEDEEVNTQVEIQEARVDVEERVSQHSSNHGGEETNAGVDNAAFTELEEEDAPSPYAYYSALPPPPISESPPPPPASEPPALNPGTPVTDLDDGETVIVPPPLPPAPAESIYAKIDKTRSNNSSKNDGPYTSMYGYRDMAEIQIIEKEKF